MNGLPIPDEELARRIEIWERHGRNVSHAAAEIGITRQPLQDQLKRAARMGMVKPDGMTPAPGFAVKSHSVTTNEAGEVVRESVKHAQEAGEPFSVPAGHSVKGYSVLTDANSNVVAQWVKTTADRGAVCIEAIIEAFAEWQGHAAPTPRPDASEADLCTVYPIADLHLGMLAWHAETGESYDLKIASERLMTCAAKLMARSPNSRQAVILVLGDFFHADSQTNTTPASGHQLDVDGRYKKVLVAGVRLLQSVVDMALRKHDSVLVRIVPGNHDPHASVALEVALSAFYGAEPRLTVDVSAGEWFFYRFGQTLIGAHHGHRSKPEALAMAMASWRRKDWGETAYRWILTGHIHHYSAKEVGDVVVESFRTIAGKDAYSAAHGYTSGASLASITLHHEHGEESRSTINLPPVWTAAA